MHAVLRHSRNVRVTSILVNAPDTAVLLVAVFGSMLAFGELVTSAAKFQRRVSVLDSLDKDACSSQASFLTPARMPKLALKSKLINMRTCCVLTVCFCRL